MGMDGEQGTETCDFWIGVFPDEDAFSEYVGEAADFYTRRGEDGEPQGALSRFIADQGTWWYDHDLVEMGFNANTKSVAELVEGYSYADQYHEELARRAEAAGILGANGFLFIRSGEIENPHSVKTAEFHFAYVGKITYRI